MMLALGFLRASSELKTCVTYSKYMADGWTQRSIFRIEIFYVPFGSVYSMYFYLFFGRGIGTYQNSKYSRIVIYIVLLFFLVVFALCLLFLLQGFPLPFWFKNFVASASLE